jgi:hypothetical protein
MAIRINNDTIIDNSKNINAGVGTFTNLNVTPNALVFNPVDGATSVVFNPTISITFSQLIQKGSGNITLRSGSAGGTILQTIAVSSGSVSISGSTANITPPSPLPPSTDVYVVVDAGAFTSINFTSPTGLINTYNFTTGSSTLNSTTPSNGATNQLITTNITLNFTGLAPVRGTGTITLRSGSASGTILESFDAASSGRISVSGNNWILDPTSDLPYDSSIFLVVPNTAIVNFAGLNVSGGTTYSFTTAAPALGAFYEGGYLICKASPVRWIVSPFSAEVSRSWYLRTDANTRAQQVSGCAGWFVPTASQLQNPGFICRSFWGPSPCYNVTAHGPWSDTQSNSNHGCAINFINGALIVGGSKNNTRTVRAFRCVTY